MIYFAQAGDGGPVKIGFSSNVESRLASLRCASASEIVLLNTRPGSMKAERLLHSRLERHRLRGEWFEPAEDVLAEAASKEPVPEPEPVTTSHRPHETSYEMLNDYRNKSGASVGEFAAAILVGDRTAYRILRGEKMPDVGTACLIEKWTAGSVLVRHWLTDEQAIHEARMR